MPEPVLLAAMTEAAAKAAVANAVAMIMREIGILGYHALKGFKNQATIDKIHDHLWSVRNVKTFWLDEKAVPLKEVYHHVPVMVPVFGRRSGQKNRRTIIRYISDFHAANKNILIEGSVGQGKSMLLRHLALSELFNSTRFPVFLELRRVRWGTVASPLLAGVLEHFTKFGISMDSRALSRLFETGRVTLLLDGFDEVDLEHQASAFEEIASICDMHVNLQVIITSRPESGCRKSSHFRPFPMADLDERGALSIIGRACQIDPRCQSLRDRFDTIPDRVRAVLTTPLVVSMLIRQYISTRELPASIADIYKNLFGLYFRENDRAKPAFRRTRLSNLDHLQLHEVFCAVCHSIRKSGKSMLPEIDFYRLLKEHQASTNASTEAIVEDIVATTLLLREGSDLLFPHSSVLEFHSAQFVRMMPWDYRSQFYNNNLNSRGLHKWEAELKHLREIDKNCYLQHFEFPALRMLSLEFDEQSVEGRWAALRVFDDMFFIDIENSTIRNNGRGPGMMVFRHLFDDDAFIPDGIAEKMMDISTIADRWGEIMRISDDVDNPKLCFASTLLKIGALTDFGLQCYINRHRRVQERLKEVSQRVQHASLA